MMSAAGFVPMAQAPFDALQAWVCCDFLLCSYILTIRTAFQVSLDQDDMSQANFLPRGTQHFSVASLHGDSCASSIRPALMVSSDNFNSGFGINRFGDQMQVHNQPTGGLDCDFLRATNPGFPTGIDPSLFNRGCFDTNGSVLGAQSTPSPLSGSTSLLPLAPATLKGSFPSSLTIFGQQLGMFSF